MPRRPFRKSFAALLTRLLWKLPEIFFRRRLAVTLDGDGAPVAIGQGRGACGSARPLARLFFALRAMEFAMHLLGPHVAFVSAPSVIGGLAFFAFFPLRFCRSCFVIRFARALS